MNVWEFRKGFLKKNKFKFISLFTFLSFMISSIYKNNSWGWWLPSMYGVFSLVTITDIISIYRKSHREYKLELVRDVMES